MELPETLKQNFREVSFTRNDVIFFPGNTCNSLYFIKEGMVKLSCFKEGKEFVLRFFWENQFFTVIDSFMSGEPSDCQVSAIEDVSILSLHKDLIEKHCAENPDFAAGYRNLISLSSLNLIRRVKELLTENASKRYQLFQENNRDIVNRLSLGDTAKYIGISQVSLSRLRNQKY